MEEVLEAMRLAGANAGMSGAFSDPRSMVYRTSSSQAVKVVSPSMLMTPPADATRNERPVEIDVPWEDTGATPQKRPPLALIAGGAATAILVLGVVVFLMRKPAEVAKPPPAPPPPPVVTVKKLPPPVEPPPLPVVAQISFSVQSSPSGANVTRDGVVLGLTPLTFTLPAGADHSASAELTLSLDGHQPVTVTAQGTGPEVVVKQTMPRLKKTTAKKNNPPGYKDDPYQ